LLLTRTPGLRISARCSVAFLDAEVRANSKGRCSTTDYAPKLFNPNKFQMLSLNIRHWWYCGAKPWQLRHVLVQLVCSQARVAHRHSQALVTQQLRFTVQRQAILHKPRSERMTLIVPPMIPSEYSSAGKLTAGAHQQTRQLLVG